LHLNGPKAIVQWVSSNWREGDLVLTMGAGSISKVGHQLAEICQQLVAGNFLPKVE
jgi:UDP-N-acetylmuramate-alanine ligase